MTAGLSRNKGKAGERELATLLAELTGHDVRRRVRQHDGDDDLMGLPGWSIECKRYAVATPTLVQQWWRQAVQQAWRVDTDLRPVLFYRADRGEWCAVWHAGRHCKEIATHMNGDMRDTLTATPETWWRMVRKLQS